jgi:hypothetical protein
LDCDVDGYDVLEPRVAIADDDWTCADEWTPVWELLLPDVQLLALSLLTMDSLKHGGAHDD